VTENAWIFRKISGTGAMAVFYLGTSASFRVFLATVSMQDFEIAALTLPDALTPPPKNTSGYLLQCAGRRQSDRWSIYPCAL
jgi:hypothetical protein